MKNNILQTRNKTKKYDFKNFKGRKKERKKKIGKKHICALSIL